ncbi:LSM domain-containing protein [Melampsora americana]|nr:LSM domain-containing protein [Melampsora americana]KAH9809435.1 LSM domain-containing protein [Melampsora americana]
MSDRGRGRGGGRGGGSGGGSNRNEEKPKREAILDLSKYVNQRVIVKFMGGRQITGILKGYDGLLNLVMDEVEETLKPEDSDLQSHIPNPETKTRSLGLAVIRGTSLVVISPVEGFEEIANPFINQQ